MTLQEAAVVETYTGIVMCAGDKRKYVYEYASNLIGRPIYTHEFATMADKLKELSKPDFLKICENLSDSESRRTHDTITVNMKIDDYDKFIEDVKKEIKEILTDRKEKIISRLEELLRDSRETDITGEFNENTFKSKNYLLGEQTAYIKAIEIVKEVMR